jgi:hypothetical protein
MTRSAAEAFVADLERRLAPLDRGILLAEWRRVAGISHRGAGVWEDRRHGLLERPGLLETVRAHLDAGYGGPLERRLHLLERIALTSRIEQDPEIVHVRERLRARIASFRPMWHGRRVPRNVVRQALRTSPDRAERRRAYYAEDPLYRPLEVDLRRLIALRNERARDYGFRSFPEFQLSFDGLSVSRFEELVESALRHVPAGMRLRRDEFQERTGQAGWFPWDGPYSGYLARGLPDASFPPREMVAAVVTGVREWGVPPSALRFRVTRHDLSAGGICLAPDPPKDVRIVVHPDAGGLTSYRTLFHEVGHAVHSASTRARGHLLRWHEGVPGFGGFREGIGEFFTLIPESEAWLRSRVSLPPESIRSFRAEVVRAPLAEAAFLSGWTANELGLYLRPHEDPSERSLRWERRTFGFDPHPARSFADAFYIGAPVYATSYLIAMLVRAQIASAVLDQVGGPIWPNRRIGPWLIDRWFRDGSSYDWLPRIREVTGRPFGAAAFNAAMARAIAGA